MPGATGENMVHCLKYFHFVDIVHTIVKSFNGFFDAGGIKGWHSVSTGAGNQYKNEYKNYITRHITAHSHK